MGIQLYLLILILNSNHCCQLYVITYLVSFILIVSHTCQFIIFNMRLHVMQHMVL